MNNILILMASILALIVNSSTLFLLSKYDLFRKKPAIETKTAAQTQIRKTKAINIPALEGKEVKGYFLIQFAVVTVGGENAIATLDDLAEVYVLDEALTKIYGMSNNYGTKLDKSNISGLAPAILQAVQNKIGNDRLKDVLVHDFTYIPRADVR